MSGTFVSFFTTATGSSHFHFQRSFAEAAELPALVNIPTGLGKTAMAVVGWLWRRFGAGDEVRRQTPRRLVYCLPMRVLVEQTRDNAIRWLHNLGRLGGDVTFDPPPGAGVPATPSHGVATYAPSAGEPDRVAVYVLMGGEDEDDWDIYPEREAIIIGTQDMLLSRALNRGYAASRSRWPIQFGLLHTDCLWVFDEIQLMGSGLATTAQLEAFRRLLPRADAEAAKAGHGCKSVWMSATLRPEWLKTVDFKGRVDGLACLELGEDDRKQGEGEKRWNAKKPLTRANATMGDASKLANEIRQAHKVGTRTIVVVNTVRRACELFIALNPGGDGQSARGRKAANKQKPQGGESEATTTAPRIVLLHSRFRPDDRKERIDAALADPPSEGTIVVSTQVIEAGVDVSATTLFTELAPWASLVQRFGRCNRRGEQNEHACVRWIDVREEEAAPYDPEDLEMAREALKAIGEKPEAQRNVSLAALSELDVKLPFNHTHVIRRRDLIDLFDTTPDLAGNDIDIDRFVREVEDSDVRVFWRDYGDPRKGATPNNIGGKEANGGRRSVEPAPRREELCPAPIGAFRDFAKMHGGQVWRWNFLDETWVKVDAAKVTPGQVYLAHADAGGYSAGRGWDPESTTRVEPVLFYAGKAAEPPDATDDDRLARAGVWQTIAGHTEEVCREVDNFMNALPLDDARRAALRTAARWHDLGKAHETFRTALPDGTPDATKLWAKAAGQWKRYGRRHFRHELASALAVLQRPHGTLKTLSDDDLNLVAYLVAAHHGKVRLSIRSLPNEMRPNPVCGASDGKCSQCQKPGWSPLQRRFARGVWDGDTLPASDLGGGVSAPAVILSLEPMELGLCEQPPFARQPSWAERMIRLRDTLGPFRLAYLEAILRAADMRASIAAEQSTAASNQNARTSSSGASEGAVQ